MSEDRLLHMLGNLARFDERWDRLAAGTLSPDEEQELRALAETDADAKAAYEAFRPLGPAFTAQVTAALRATMDGGGAVAAATPAAPVLPFRRRARSVAGWGALAAAVAATVALVLLRPAPLPDYALAELDGGVQTTRGAAGDLGALAPGDPFRVALRPATAVAGGGKLVAKGFLVGAAGRRPVLLESRFDAGGAVRVEGTLASDLAAGDWTLWVLVGRPGALPDAAAVPAGGAATPRGRGWVAVPVRLQVGPPRAP